MALALPLLPGKTAAFREFVAEVHGARFAEYTASEQRIGVTKENWHLQPTPNGDLWILYLESADLNAAVGGFIMSQDSFDVWFKQKLLELTGLDFSVPPPGPLSECVGAYEA